MFSFSRVALVTIGALISLAEVWMALVILSIAAGVYWAGVPSALAIFLFGPVGLTVAAWNVRSPRKVWSVLLPLGLVITVSQLLYSLNGFRDTDQLVTKSSVSLEALLVFITVLTIATGTYLCVQRWRGSTHAR